MANQKATLKVNTPSGPRDIRVTLVDTDATASTFADYGAATVIFADSNWVPVDLVGYGTTAPATALAFQFRVNGNDRSAFAVGAAIFDPTSTAQARLGAAYGKTIPQGASLAIIGRA